MRLIATIAAGLAFTLSAVSAERPTHVSMVALLANPEKFDGHFVRVDGFLRIEFEGHALYFHKEDYDRQLTKNSLWLGISKSGEEYAEFNLHYVAVEGVFRANNYGHMNAFGGAIENIRRIKGLQ
jgi:hypothetical protein